MTKLPFFIASIVLISCTSTSGKELAVKETLPQDPGKEIYDNYCKVCHGAKGSLGLSGATNLKKSTLTLEERIEVITFGRNGMAPHKDILTASEIREVAIYIESLHEQ